jgi:cupin fold WbuC family metalloprotein
VTAPSKAVLAPDADVVQAGDEEILALRRLADEAPLGRARLCAHRDPSDPLHEMLIVLVRSTYVRPHRHPGKTESFHVVEGLVDVPLFDEHGQLTEIVRLGAHGSGRPFYYRLNVPSFHTVVVRSDAVVLHETTNGPFDPADTVFAPWAPDPDDEPAARSYAERLDERIASLRGRA